jgi:hypothetical protein
MIETMIIIIILFICTLIGLALVLEPFLRHENDKINQNYKEQKDGNNT